jgi:hypothetical protein
MNIPEERALIDPYDMQGVIEALPDIAYAVEGEDPAIDFFPVHGLHWRTGNSESWLDDGENTPIARYAGWCIERREPETYEDYLLNDAMRQLCDMNTLVRNKLVPAAQRIIVMHKGDDGSMHEVFYWSLAKATLFVPIRFLPSKDSDDGRNTGGIAYAWRPVTKGKRIGQKESVLRFHCFVKELMDAGYRQPLSVAMRGHITGKMRNALKLHNRTLNLVNSIKMLRARADGKPTPSKVPYYSFGLPVIRSMKTETVGTPPDNSSNIYYPVAEMPEDLYENALSAQQYLSNTMLSREYTLLVEEGDRINATAAWSEREVTRIIGGTDPDDTQIPTADSYVPVGADGESIVAPF